MPACGCKGKGGGGGVPRSRIIVRASPTEEESALNLAAHRKLVTAPIFPPFDARAARATSSATMIFAGYWMTMRDLSSPDAEDMKWERVVRFRGGEEGRARRRWRIVWRAFWRLGWKDLEGGSDMVKVWC